MTIVEFITARLEEDERVARHAFDSDKDGADRWQVDGANVWTEETRPTLVVKSAWPNEVAHIAANDPAAALRRCAGVRRAVDAEIGDLYGWDGELGDGCELDQIRAGRCTDRFGDIERSGVLRALASFWSHHPDYRKEWAIDGE